MVVHKTKIKQVKTNKITSVFKYVCSLTCAIQRTCALMNQNTTVFKLDADKRLRRTDSKSSGNRIPQKKSTPKQIHTSFVTQSATHILVTSKLQNGTSLKLVFVISRDDITRKHAWFQLSIWKAWDTHSSYMPLKKYDCHWWEHQQ